MDARRPPVRLLDGSAGLAVAGGGIENGILGSLARTDLKLTPAAGPLQIVPLETPQSPPAAAGADASLGYSAVATFRQARQRRCRPGRSRMPRLIDLSDTVLVTLCGFGGYRPQMLLSLFCSAF
jgi:hypothetical protein